MKSQKKGRLKIQNKLDNKDKQNYSILRAYIKTTVNRADDTP